MLIAYLVTQKVALKAAKSSFLVGLNEGKGHKMLGLKVALKHLFGGSKVHLSLQSLLQSPVVFQSRTWTPGRGWCSPDSGLRRIAITLLWTAPKRAIDKPRRR